jgi:hypothetical protein
LSRPASPQRTFEFERRLRQLLDAVGRAIVEWTYNASEPADANSLPARLQSGADEYRRNRKTPRQVATLFGPIRLSRCVYQAVAAGMPGFFPLEHALGIVAHAATPALADAVGRLAAELTQQQTLDALAERHHVRWSVGLLRKVTATLAEALAPLRHAAQVAQLVAWLEKAEKSRGKFRPTLAVGRDGVMVPMRPCWEEASTATVSVHDRRGKRLGTVYLGRMPEPGQGMLGDQLTQLLQAVFAAWQGVLPRLMYVTDAGSHPQDYFRRVLRWMKHPRTGQLLSWQWVVDYFHACEYVGKLSEALFGVGAEAAAWAARMRRVLKEDRGGVKQVLHSARALRTRRGLAGRRKDFQRAINYLWKYRHHMNYLECRRSKLPIGSGVTEAACKMIFGYRFKQSGMRWKHGHSQHVLDLRVILKSRVWEAVRDQWLRRWQPAKTAAAKPQPAKTRPKARKKLLPA